MELTRWDYLKRAETCLEDAEEMDSPEGRQMALQFAQTYALLALASEESSIPPVDLIVKSLVLESLQQADPAEVLRATHIHDDADHCLKNRTGRRCQ